MSLRVTTGDTDDQTYCTVDEMAQLLARLLSRLVAEGDGTRLTQCG